jgi:hypothetical protein
LWPPSRQPPAIANAYSQVVMRALSSALARANSVSSVSGMPPIEPLASDDSTPRSPTAASAWVGG